MRIQKHEINKYQFWHYDKYSKKWASIGDSYDSEEEVLRDIFGSLNFKNGKIINEGSLTNTEWKIVKIM